MFDGVAHDGDAERRNGLACLVVAGQFIELGQSETKQNALAKIAILPAIMCVCYLILIAYFKSKGGYKAEVLTGHAAEDEKFTGGTIGAMEG